MSEKTKQTITITLPMTEHDRATLYAEMAKALHNANARRRQAGQSQKAAQSQKATQSQKAKGGRRSRTRKNRDKARTRKLRR